ncbi:MAG: AAA family ATPase [Verrucomicrobiales bacterium]|nr:AAA family ATPase [Verrucomicrobiales bacterium]
MKTVALFNNKGGVGKTTVLYHLAWMYAELGVRVVAVDLDPQSNLTSSFLSEDRLDELWRSPAEGMTIVDAVTPLLEEGTGDILEPHLENLGHNLAMVPGDLALARVEDELSAQWANCLNESPKAFRITTAFHRAVRLAASRFRADLVLLDVGPNLGALNRCALIAADDVVVPLVPDLYSLQGLRNLGPTLRKWRKGWEKRVEEAPASLADLPPGGMQPAGYVVVLHGTRQSRPIRAYARWAEKIPMEYRAAMDVTEPYDRLSLESDPACLAQLKHYRSLVPLAMEARKPMFRLTPADGAIGAHAAAVSDCADDFRHLALRLAEVIALPIPTRPVLHRLPQER